MGGPCDKLVPAAILYANPGLRLEEFSEKLRGTIGNVRSADLGIGLPFDGYGMAQVLNLGETQHARNVNQQDYDKEFNDRKRTFYRVKDGYQVRHKRLARVLVDDLTTTIDQLTSNPEGGIEFKAGDLCDDLPNTHIPPELFGQGVCLQIMEVLETKKEECDPDDTFITQKVRVRVLDFETTEETFKDLNSLVEKYPEYDPKKMCNFRQKTGLLFPEERWLRRRKNHTFRWNMQGERYYLDLRALEANLSPNSVYAGDAKDNSGQRDGWLHRIARGPYSLSDLVLTCEAIRRKEWKVLGYIGFRIFFSDFIYSDAETLARYERAVSDSETSMRAQREGWTTSEFLREHAFGQAMLRLFNQQVPFEQRAKQYRAWKKRHDEEMTKRAVEAEAKRKEDEKNEVPF